MQDGAPCHRAKSVMKFLSEAKIPLLPWPGNSPDSNPIENLWHIAKQRLQLVTTITKEQLISEVTRIWNDPELKDICLTLIKSMPKRIDDVIKNHGYHTKY